MGILQEAWNPRVQGSSQVGVPGYGSDPLHPFWFSKDPSGFVLESGALALSAETILRCGTVLAAIRFRGDSWAMCPPSTYRKTKQGREEVPDHYSQIVLRNPNRWMTGNRWRHLNGVWMALWGNAYNEMIGGSRAVVEELRPMHPSRVRIADQREDGSLIYEYTPPGAEKRTLGQERVLHFRDISTDGLSGLAMYRLIRNVVSIALLAEKHQLTFLAKGTRISGLLIPKLPLDNDQRKQLKESVNEDLGGTSNTGTFGIMPSGVDIKPISNTNREAQFAELDDKTVGSILRFLGVPGVVVGWAEKTATYASADAFFEKGGIKHCVLPILINVEAEEEKALLPSASGLQIKHNLDVLERANLKDRTESMVRSIGGPFRTINEARTIEDLPKLDDPRYDEVLIPANMGGALETDEEDLPPSDDPLDAPVGGGPVDEPDEDPDDEARRAVAAQTIQKIYLGVGVVLSAEEARAMVSKVGFPLPGALPGPLKPGSAGTGGTSAPASDDGPGAPAPPDPEAIAASQDDDTKALRARAEWLALSAAARQVRREIAAVTDKAKTRIARDRDAWSNWVQGYYDREAAHVAETLNLQETAARAHCRRQAEQLLAGGLVVTQHWERDVAPQLAALALGQGA